MSLDRYPNNWNELSSFIKVAASWRCQKCGQLWTPTNEKNPGQWPSYNFKPEDNRLENLVALCTGCHLGYHQNRRGNLSPGQLELW